MPLHTWQPVRLSSSLYANMRNLQTPYCQKAMLILFFTILLLFYQKKSLNSLHKSETFDTI